MITAPNLSKFKECLDNTLRHGLVLGSPGRNRELDSKILMSAFQFEILYDAMMGVTPLSAIGQECRVLFI